MEIFKEIAGHENYEVSNFGNVRRKDTKVEIKQSLLYDGNLIVGLYKNGKQKFLQVHRLVAIAFVINHNNLRNVRRINGDKSDNRSTNLQWVKGGNNKPKKRRVKAYKLKQINLKLYGI